MTAILSLFNPLLQRYQHTFGYKMYSSAFPSSCSSRAGLGAPAACSRHVGTSPCVCRDSYCVMGQMFGGCVVAVCYHAAVCAGSPIWDANFTPGIVPAGRQTSSSAPPSSTSSTSRLRSFLPADARLRLSHPFPSVSQQQIVARALGRCKINPQPAAGALTQILLANTAAAETLFEGGRRLRFKPN